ncbi:MAG: hypothetical protein NT004_19025 [Bacteroidetes bacterium]|nr:hypothetical protein [Bacteroidota bacterium]
MKKIFAIICLISVILSGVSCSKKESAPSATVLTFNSLAAVDTVIKVNDITTITANAIGDGVTYKWSATYGTFIGSGAQVQWTVCHEAKFTITCEVTDQNNNSQTKQIVIRSHN